LVPSLDLKMEAKPTCFWLFILINSVKFSRVETTIIIPENLLMVILWSVS
jgi:hypothetical protein